MSKNVRNIVAKELFALTFILLLGALFIFDPTDTKSFNYPLAMRPEWRERFQVLGWAIVYGGYPVRAAVKLFLWVKK